MCRLVCIDVAPALSSANLQAHVIAVRIPSCPSSGPVPADQDAAKSHRFQEQSSAGAVLDGTVLSPKPCRNFCKLLQDALRLPCPWSKARFAFSRGGVVREVPYDPHLEYVPLGVFQVTTSRLMRG